MTGVTPHGIRYPDGASKAKNLGPELQQMAEDIDAFIDEEIALEVATQFASSRIGATGPSYADLNTVPEESGWLRALSSTANKPTIGGGYTVLQLFYSSGNVTQMAFGVGSSVPWFRRKNGGVWGPWARVATLIPSVHYNSATGRWVWDMQDNPAAATHYIVRVDGRWRIVSTPFPTPSATAPAIDWN